MKLTVIVPARNEAAQIEACLKSLRREHAGELIVADGGSTDGTPALAEALGATVLRCEPGLAGQINRAVDAASGDVVFLVAADSRPEPGWMAAIESALVSPYVLGGGFRLQLDDNHWGLRLITWGGNFRSRYLGITLPDQGLFVRRDAFRDVGGMATGSLIPYVLLCHRLKEGGEFRVLSHAMVSSARKWRDYGMLRTTGHHVWTYLKFKFRELPPHW